MQCIIYNDYKWFLLPDFRFYWGVWVVWGRPHAESFKMWCRLSRKSPGSPVLSAGIRHGSGSGCRHVSIFRSFHMQICSICHYGGGELWANQCRRTRATAIITMPMMATMMTWSKHTDAHPECCGGSSQNLHYPRAELNEMRTLAKHLIIAIS